ncbi:hypothetical protein B0I37DRAFT_357706 [Chaetomium sp. MPI-CAGE-AT-0009]|nr:hypothetical protein B0I37DRAFT_357706 [Chaetomium sp. MPI-CAGE-AT-0009]
MFTLCNGSQTSVAVVDWYYDHTVDVCGVYFPLAVIAGFLGLVVRERPHLTRGRVECVSFLLAFGRRTLTAAGFGKTSIVDGFFQTRRTSNLPPISLDSPVGVVVQHGDSTPLT